MKKKLLSILLVLCISCGMLGHGMIARAESEKIDDGDKKAVDTMRGIGLIQGYEDGSFRPNEILTRAEFASIMSSLFSEEEKAPETETHNSGEWNSEFYGTEYIPQEEELLDETQHLTFFDVPQEHWAFNAINTAYYYGLMNGIGDNMFAPDREISVDEAITTVVNILGYSSIAESYGGYPNGYVTMAYQLHILDGIDMSGFSNGIKRSQVARLLYNALDVKIMKVAFTEKNERYVSDDTILTQYLKILNVKGMVSDNGITTTIGRSEVSENEVVIGNVRMTISKEGQAIRDEIGLEVDAYYHVDDDDEKTLLYYDVLSKNNVITITADEIDEFTQQAITYTSGEYSRYKRYDFVAGTRYIYNGSSVSTLTDDMIDIDSGYVKIITNDTPILVIRNYRTAYAGYIDSERFEISDKLNLSSPILYDTDDKYVTVKDSSGNFVEIDALEDADVLMVSEGTDSMEFVIGSKVVSGIVTSTSLAEQIVTVDGTEYKLSDEFVASDYDTSIKLNDNVNIYLSADNKVAWVDVLTKSDTGYGYIYKCFEDSDENWKVKIYTSRGIHEEYELASKIVYRDENRVQTSIEKAAYGAYLTGFKGFVSYTLNKDLQIKKIYLPLNDADVNELHKIYEISPDNSTMLAYKSSIRSFGWKINATNDTSFISVPENISDRTREYVPASEKTGFSREDFKMITFNDFRDNQRYCVTGYTTVANSTLADFVVCYGQPTSTADVNGQLGIVTGIRVGLDEDDEPRTYIKMIYQRNEKEYTAAEGIDFSNVPSDNDGTNSYPLDIGDCVRFAANSKNEVEDIYLVYDADATNPSGGNGGYLADATEKFYARASKVSIGNGTNTIYTEIGNANGFFLNTGNPYCSNKDKPAYHSLAERKITLGYALSSDGMGITMTTQDMTTYPTYFENGVPSDAAVEDGRVGIFIEDNISLYNVPIDYLKIERKSAEVRPGAISDIRTYEDAGSNCSKILVVSHYGDIRQVIVIDDKFVD